MQTNFVVLDSTHETLTIDNADGINHIVIFMTGAQPLPENLGGAG